jgi:nucleoside-diphosphate-sugar epimerase
MIIGNGLLASALKLYDDEEFLFIAAGVSDSKCGDRAAFKREEEMLLESIAKHSDKLCIFFSTCSIHDPSMKNNMYVRRKLQFEDLVRSKCPEYMIVRISNLVGRGGNPNNVFNYFLNAIYTSTPFKLWASATRNLILVEDFTRILNDVLLHSKNDMKNNIVHIFNPRDYSALEIVRGMEEFMGKKAIYELVEIESKAYVPDTFATTEFNRLNIKTELYLERILNTHFKEYKAVSLPTP